MQLQIGSSKYAEDKQNRNGNDKYEKKKKPSSNVVILGLADEGICG